MSRRGFFLAARLVGVGWYIALSIILGTMGGVWLDRRLETSFFTLVGVAVGSVVAFYGVYRMVVPLLNSDNDVNKH